MTKFSGEIWCSIGVTLLICGSIALSFGIQVTMPPPEAAFLCVSGGVLAAVGSGMLTFGGLLIRSRKFPTKLLRNHLD